MRDDKGRSFFGMTNGENDFALYPEVVRVVEWIERQSARGPARQRSSVSPESSSRT